MKSPLLSVVIPTHNEAEATSFEECAAGAQVLLNAVLEFDRRVG